MTFRDPVRDLREAKGMIQRDLVSEDLSRVIHPDDLRRTAHRLSLVSHMPGDGDRAPWKPAFHTVTSLYQCPFLMAEFGGTIHAVAWWVTVPASSRPTGSDSVPRSIWPSALNFFITRSDSPVGAGSPYDLSDAGPLALTDSSSWRFQTTEFFASYQVMNHEQGKRWDRQPM